MQVTIQLDADAAYRLQLASQPATGLGQTAIVYLHGREGSACLGITDAHSEQLGPWDVSVPGMLTSVLRETSEPGMSAVEIVSGSQGFFG